MQLTCVAVSPSSFKLCALRDRDSDGPNFDAELRSSSIAAARLRNSTKTTKNKCERMKNSLFCFVFFQNEIEIPAFLPVSPKLPCLSQGELDTLRVQYDTE